MLNKPEDVYPVVRASRCGLGKYGVDPNDLIVRISLDVHRLLGQPTHIDGIVCEVIGGTATAIRVDLKKEPAFRKAHTDLHGFGAYFTWQYTDALAVNLKNGGKYRIVNREVTNRTNTQDGQKMVLYVDQESNVHVRSESEFVEKFKLEALR